MEKERLLKYDWVRAIAAMMVVSVHCLPGYEAPLLGKVSSHSYVVLIQSLFLTCNILFFMLSGKFNIRQIDNSELPKYYYKKVRGVFVPTVVFIVIHTMIGIFPNYGSILHVCKVLFLNTLGAMGHGIFWFVFSLLGMLMVAPFIAKSFNELSEKHIWALFIVWIIWQSAYFMSANLGLDFSWSFPMRGFFFYFCIGPCIERSQFNRLKTLHIAAIGACACVGTALFAYFGWMNGVYDNTPLYGITGISLYLLLLRIKPMDNRVINVLISLIAKHSFGLYLMHWLIYVELAPRFQFLSQIWGPLYHSCLSVSVFVLGLIAAIIADTVLVKPTQRLFDSAFSAYGKAMRARSLTAGE